MIGSALAFGLLLLLPVDFSYPLFAAILLLMGLSMGAFASPNRAGVMNSLPAEHRGAGGGMNQTFQNSAQVLSIGIFFTLMILGLSATLPHTLASGLTASGVSPTTAAGVAHLPPVSVVFAAFLGYNPAKELLGPHVLSHLSAHDAATISGRGFFPHLTRPPSDTACTRRSRSRSSPASSLPSPPGRAASGSSRRRHAQPSSSNPKRPESRGRR